MTPTPASTFQLKPFAKKTLIFMVIVFIPALLMQFRVFKAPFRGFARADPELSHPHPTDRVSDSLLIFISFVLPQLILVLVDCLGVRPSGKWFWRGLHPLTYALVLLVWLNFGMTLFWTDFVKVTSLQHRPDFITRCKPDYAKWDALNLVLKQPPNFITVNVCTGDEKEIEKGMRSFPSGHASLGICGVALVAFYLQLRFARIAAKAGPTSMWSPALVSVQVWLFAFGFWVGLTRLADGLHSLEDVVCGWIVGLLSAYIVAYKFYPGVRDECEPDNKIHVSGSSDTEMQVAAGADGVLQVAASDES